ncbi:MAG: hypothetical protein V1861_00830 [Candidatus Micrarchaeota archaeon]
MKFTVAKREVEAGWGHALLAIGVMLFEVAAGFVISAALALAMGGSDIFTAFIYASLWFSTLFSIINYPLAAYLLLLGGRWMRLKGDDAFCRSAPATLSIVKGATYAFFFGLFMLIAILMRASSFQNSMSYLFPAFGLPYIAGVILGMAAGAVTTYLWLRIFLKAEMGRLKSAAAYAVLFSLGALVLDEAAAFLIGYAAGAPQELELGLGTAKDFVMYFLLALPILYHTAGRKLDMEAAKFYSAAYFGSAAAFTVHNALLGAVPELTMALSLVQPLVALALLYALSRSKDDIF